MHQHATDRGTWHVLICGNSYIFDFVFYANTRTTHPDTGTSTPYGKLALWQTLHISQKSLCEGPFCKTVPHEMTHLYYTFPAGTCLALLLASASRQPLNNSEQVNSSRRQASSLVPLKHQTRRPPLCHQITTLPPQCSAALIALTCHIRVLCCTLRPCPSLNRNCPSHILLRVLNVSLSATAFVCSFFCSCSCSIFYSKSGTQVAYAAWCSFDADACREGSTAIDSSSTVPALAYVCKGKLAHPLVLPRWFPSYVPCAARTLNFGLPLLGRFHISLLHTKMEIAESESSPCSFTKETKTFCLWNNRCNWLTFHDQQTLASEWGCRETPHLFEGSCLGRIPLPFACLGPQYCRCPVCHSDLLCSCHFVASPKEVESLRSHISLSQFPLSASRDAACRSHRA